MIVQELPIEMLIPYARNARTHSDEQVAQIAGSIREFGFCNPVLIDQNGGIIAGHGRVLAARKLGMQEVPCIRLGHLTDVQRRAYILADNKLALNAGWDEAMLGLELSALEIEDFDLGLLGFDDAELNQLLEGSDLPAEGGSDGNVNVKETEHTEYIPRSYAVQIDVASEEEQIVLIEKMTGEGFKCTPLIF